MNIIEGASQSDNTAGQPLVDVIIPVRNGIEYVRETLDSVFAQTLTNFRLVIVDNNSSDGTAELVRTLQDPRVISVRHSETLSLFENLNASLSQARAPFFCLLHADDRLRPEYLERMVASLASDVDAALACCRVAVIDAAGGTKSNLNYSVKNLVKSSIATKYPVISRRNWRGRLLRVFNYFVSPCILYRRDVIETIGRFREDLAFFGDMEYLMRGLSKGFTYLVVPETLFEYRVHERQETRNLSKSLRRYTETLEFFSRESGRHDQADKAVARRRLAERRVALVVMWDYMTARGQDADTERSKLIEFLLSNGILSRYSGFWKLLGNLTLGRGVSTLLSGLAVCLVTPAIAWRAISRSA